MIRHLVFFRFKPEVTEAQREDFLTMLMALPAHIEEIREFEIGRDILHTPRSFDAALVATYDDLTALNRYLNHPAHKPVAERAKELCLESATVDHEYSRPN